MKIAVVGSGISGLVCAHHLSRHAEVHVFEAGDHIGGHTNTIMVSTPAGPLPVDTGFIVFNDRTYPRFLQLMNSLHVPSQPSHMSFSVKKESTGLEYNGTNLNGLFAQRSNLLSASFYGMIRNILLFNREAPVHAASLPPENDLSLGQYLKDHSYSQAFIDHYIIPMGAAIWSAGVDQMLNFPFRMFVQFFKNHGMLSIDDRPQWRVIKNGSHSYIPALTKDFADRIYLNSPVRSVKRDESGVTMVVDRNGQHAQSRFDQVVFASHADQTLRLLADADEQERAVLEAFAYQKNETILHTDTSVLPKRRRAWAAWNYLIPENPQSTVAVTYNMNILQSLPSAETYLVSLNMERKIRAERVIKTITYHHPVYTPAAVQAQTKWSAINGKRRTYFCGAYWGYGFHEDGVRSAERVCSALGSPVL